MVIRKEIVNSRKFMHRYRVNRERVEVTILDKADVDGAVDMEKGESHMEKFECASGRTVDLGNYQSGKVIVTLSLLSDEKPNIVLGKMNEVVKEIVEREESELRRQDRDRVSIPNIAGKERRIGIMYSLTLKMSKQYESRVETIGRTVPIGDDADLVEEFEKLQDWVGAAVDIASSDEGKSIADDLADKFHGVEK